MIRIADIKYASLVRTTSILLRSECADNGVVADVNVDVDEGSESVSQSREGVEHEHALEEYTFRSFHDRQNVLCVILDAYKNLVGQDFSNDNCPPGTLVLKREDEHKFTTPLRNIMRLSRGNLDHDGMSPVQQRHVRVDVTSSFDSVANDGNLNGLPRMGSGSFEEQEQTRLLAPRRRANTSESAPTSPLGRPRRRALSTSTLLNNSIGANGGKRKKKKRKGDILKRWDEKKAAFESFNEIGVENKTMSISLEDFYNKFLADSAPHSMPSFQTNIMKDEDVQCSPWDPKVDRIEDGDESYIECARMMSYTHKRNSRIGPSSVFLEKKQIFRKYGRHGIVFNQTSKAKGVPYSVQLQDEWIIEAQGGNGQGGEGGGGGGTIVINARFRICFDDKPPAAFIKKTIMSASRTGLKTWFEQYCNMLDSTVGGGGTSIATTAMAGSGVTKGRYLLRYGSYDFWFSFLLVIVLVFLFVLVNLYFKITSLEAQVHYLRVVNEAILKLVAFNESIVEL